MLLATLAMPLLLWSAAASSDVARPNAALTQFTIATVNIRGLPGWISGDDPAGRIPILLTKLEPLDIVLLQEDFAHQALVDAHARQPTRVRGNTGASNGLIRAGDGLTLLTRLATIGDPLHAAYGSCHGWFSAASDCFADKGYLMQRISLSGGIRIDVWTTHLDAGSHELDRAARQDQLDRLAEALETHSRGQAIVIGGDFNLNWNDADDRDQLRQWLSRTGLSIAVLTPEGARERRVDYLFTRAALDSELVCDEGGIVPDLSGPTDAPLTDHPALRSTCRVLTTKALDLSPDR